MTASLELRPANTKGRTIDLLIADENSMNCQLLQSALRHRSVFRVAACAISKDEVLSVMNCKNVDIALINESLQDGPLTGLSVLNELRASFPRTRVIVLLKSPREDLVVDAFRAGARGIFCHAKPLHLICKCITAVHEGQIWATSSELSAVLDAFASPSTLRTNNSQGEILLTKREKDVVRLVVEGYTNRDAAKQLGLTEHTVSNYLFRIYDKLGISSRVELVLNLFKGS